MSGRVCIIIAVKTRPACVTIDRLYSVNQSRPPNKDLRRERIQQLIIIHIKLKNRLGNRKRHNTSVKSKVNVISKVNIII